MTIVLSAGGTGGHLFPAQALAAELGRRGRKIVIMTDPRGHNYGEAFPGAVIETVPSGNFSGGLKAKLFAPLQILRGIAVARGKLKNLKPSAVVGFGGYPSLPVVVAASLAGIPSAIHEQNTVLGRVNRLVAKRVRAIAASFPFARFAPDASKVVMTGNPVRPAAAALQAVPYAAPDANGPIRLLVFGGSQGARILSEVIPAAIAAIPESIRQRLEIVQQCRPEDMEMVRRAYANAHVKAELAPFFGDMPERMARAHLVIARSGASTLAELCVIGRPSILIPYPFATDDHQTANAQVLERSGAAWRIQQSDLSVEQLTHLLVHIFADPANLSRHAAAARSLARPDAAARLADLVERLSERPAA